MSKLLESLMVASVFGVIVVALFLIFREVVCWYWKINRGVVLLEEGVRLLREIRDAATRTEQDNLARQAAELRRNAGGSGQPSR